MKREILISLAVLASFGFPTSVIACSIIATPEALESRARSAAEARLRADVIVIGYLSEPIPMDYKSKTKSEKKIPVRVYEIVFPKKVLRGITKKTYRVTNPLHPCIGGHPPRGQLMQLYLNKQKTGWAVVAYDRLSQ